MNRMPHSCQFDPEGCTDACDARREAAYGRSPEGRRRLVAVRRVESRHAVPLARLTTVEDRGARLREYDAEEAR